MTANLRDLAEGLSQRFSGGSPNISLASHTRSNYHFPNSALFAFSSKGGSVQRCTIWIGLFSISLFTWRFTSTRWLLQTRPDSAEDYELLGNALDDESGEEGADPKLGRSTLA